ncbi:hypothetical protein FPV67DRAFT_1626399 [Lyophyllum atratum]|nr:hypothetical protein FPV67DRAFT_1626399 [Lyophyllum atratum]
MSKKDRFWTTNPFRAHTTEYLTQPDTTTAPPSTPPSSPSSNSPESEDRNDSGSETKDQEAPLAPPPRSQSFVSSAPDSLFSLNCRCGIRGDGNILYRQEDGVSIQCDECKDWSHIACQRGGRASDLGKNAPFECDFFINAISLLICYGSRRKIEAETRLHKPLQERLKPGTGALARRGEFWYPVRVIQRPVDSKSGWKVRWWRECTFAMPGLGPDSTIPLSEIVDSLWMDRTGRRKIRLGKWRHAHTIPTSEDILADPSTVPFTTEVDDALSLHKDILRKLLDAPATVPSSKVPVKAYIDSAKKNPSTTLIPYVGSLSIIERAQVANWFEKNISHDKKRRHEWLGRLAIAHAHTLLIASRLEHEPKFENCDEDARLEKAWELQFTDVPSIDKLLIDVDVDRESLEKLEAQMFEQSSAAGIAGHFQWGLDAGDHQDGWDPYAGLPEDWCHGDRIGSETELEVSGDCYQGHENLAINSA